MADKGTLTPAAWLEGCEWFGPVGPAGAPYIGALPLSTPPLDLTRRISGTFTEAGQPLVDARIILHWRPNMIVVARTATDKSGYYQFNKLVAGSNNYVVVMQDKDGGTVYNDIIRSLLTPG
jgi:hypothetical protein